MTAYIVVEGTLQLATQKRERRLSHTPRRLISGLHQIIDRAIEM